MAPHDLLPRLTAASALLVIVALAPSARADASRVVGAGPAPAGPAWEGPWSDADPDGEDHHERPPGWDTYATPELPPIAIASEYPLAAAFVPADPANFLPDAIVSYDYVVVHTMQGSYNGSIAWFQNPESQVSAHYCMQSKDGEVTQMVLDKDRAYHVGTMNRYALGIEHEGFVEDPDKWYTWAMYNSSARLARWLTIKHNIPVDRDHIVGHVELPNQTHTDPGPGWRWDLYMALVKEVVPPGEIRGVAVDRSHACTLTASVDTVVQRTAMPTALNAPADLCDVPAGATLRYWHARRDIDGHHRLFMPPGEGPCAGMNGLDADGYIIAADFSALCPDDSLAAVGATVRLDGGAQTVVGADGSFSFPAGEGPHTLDAWADGVYEMASEPVAVAVYPGTRVVMVLDPVPPSDSTGESGGSSESGDATGAGEVGGETTSGGEVGGSEAGGPASGGGEAGDPGSGCPPTEGFSTGPASQPALPEGYGQDDAGGCACQQAPAPTTATVFALGLLALGRRRRSCPRGQVAPRA